MFARGRALVVAAAAACIALAASAQPAPQKQQRQQQQQQRPARLRFQRAAMREARLLAIDMEGARRQGRVPINQVGRQIDFKFIRQNKVLIDQITIPVLLPSEPALAEHLRIFPNEAHYAVSSTGQGGMAFHMTGHGKAFDLMPAAVRRLPHADLRARIPGDGIVIEHTEFGLDASFNRFGAAYSISLECADPVGDKRCADDAFIRGLVARLIVVIPGDPQ